MPEFRNQAACIVGEKVRPLEVREVASPNPDDHEIVIRVAYAAVNPTDFKMQDYAYLEVPYPFVLGTDIAGTIVQLSRKATDFRLGQRVIAHCDSLLTLKAANGGYQLYSTCREILVSAVPDSIPLMNAVVLPLSVDTAAVALFHVLNIPMSALTKQGPVGNGPTVLVWGGSSSVGSSAVQLAVAVGYRVVATSSQTNANYVRGLGASIVLDHRDPGILDRALGALKPGDLVVDCISSRETQEICGKVLSAIGGGTLPVLTWPEVNFPDNVKWQLVNGLAPGFRSDELKPSFGSGAEHIGRVIWREYMPAALAAGRFQAKPSPLVLKGGLSKVQEGIDLVRDGVSARKIVIEISGEA